VTVQETIEPPTVATPPVHSVKSIRKEVDRLQELQAKQSYALMEKQLELSQKDKAVMDRIRLCFAQLEELEKKAMAVKTALAEKQAREVNRWIMTFCIAVSLLLFVLGIVIIRYTRKINAYSKALKKAKTEAERLSKVKESFISTMSHEIRTPMNAIFGFSEQLLETPLNDAQKEQVEIIKKSSDHLVGIINDILDYSKLGAGKLELNIERFKPRDIVNEVIRMMKPLAGKKNIDLNTDIAPDLPQVLLGDPMRLKQILINLVSNAVKFTDKGEVSLKCLPILENDTIVLVQFMIKDTGIGIPSSKITSIFNEFEQAEGDITRRYGGTGLGLTITQKLVTLQGGTIEVDSEEGKGTMIKFTILYKIAPVIDEPSPEKNEKYSVPTDLAILVADDEEYNRMLMTAILNKWGVIHKEVSNGEEAVRELENRKYDVVLMDVQMPVMNGLQATRYIREHPMKSSNQKIPILGVMASVSEEIRRQCMEAGMNDCLNKPFKEKELSEKISDLLNKDFMEENKTIMDEENKTNENSPGYDLSEIYKVSDNSKDFVKEMIRLFIKTTSEGLVALKRGMKNNSWEYVAYQAHKISAPCKHIAAEKLYQLLKKIEERVRNDYSTLQVGGLMEEAEAEINRLIQLLEVEYAKIQS
jgi:signal transduction histidine kinase/DNA-binding NarL/FixJ family response regulator